MAELLAMAGKVMNTEEAMASKSEGEGNGAEKGGTSGGKYQKKNKDGKKRDAEDKFADYTPLMVSCEHILNEIKSDRSLKWLERLKAPPHKRSKSLWCEFHRDHGHLTEKCFALKDEIERMLKAGKLRKYVDKRGQGADPSHLKKPKK